MVYQQMLFAQLTLPKNMYLRDMVRYVCQTICNIICSYIYISIYLLKDTQSVLPNFTSRKMPFPWPLAPAPVSPRNSASQRCAEASQSRPGESLSAAAHIWYLYVHTINAIRRSCVYIYIYDYIGICMYIYIYIYIHYTHTIICK